MEIHKIDSFHSFCETLREVGFSIGGINNEGIFSLSNYFADNIAEHTGNIETDPWEWRIRGVTECDDLAYGKLFFNKGGWITKKWFPYFMAIRREHKTFEQMYRDGLISNIAKRIYELIRDNPDIALHEIKIMLGCDKKLNSKIEATLTMLQMKMFITISGQKCKISKVGKEYGWPCTTFCTIENFFGRDIFNLSCQIDEQEAIDRISEQIFILNPNADTKAIEKFIGSSR